MPATQPFIIWHQHGRTGSWQTRRSRGRFKALRCFRFRFECVCAWVDCQIRSAVLTKVVIPRIFGCCRSAHTRTRTHIHSMRMTDGAIDFSHIATCGRVNRGCAHVVVWSLHHIKTTHLSSTGECAVWKTYPFSGRRLSSPMSSSSRRFATSHTSRSRSDWISRRRSRSQ